MISAASTLEPARLEALYDYQILDTPAEEVFDAFTRLAAQLCAAPISLISLVDEEREWLKSTSGMDRVVELPRAGSLCLQAIEDGELFEVPDTTKDERFRENLLVRGKAGIRSYAGMPLVTRSGYAIGALCVMDIKPRTLTDDQRMTLKTIAGAVIDQLDARRQLMRLVDASRSELYHFDLARQRIVFASEGALRNLGYTAREIRALALEELLPNLREPFSHERFMGSVAARDGEPMIVYTTARRKDGSIYPIELRVELVRSLARPLAYAFGVDLTERRASEARIRLLSTAIQHASDSVAIYEPSASGDPHDPSTIVYVNDAFLQSVGYTRDEVIGKTTALFVGIGDDRAVINDARSRALQGETVRFRARTYRKDGSVFWSEQVLRPLLDRSGKVTNVLSIRRDVTSEVLHEEALATQNDILTALTGVARDLFATLESRALVQKLRSGTSALTEATIGFWVALPGGGLARSEDLTAAPEARDEGDDFLRAALGSDVVLVDSAGRRAAARIPSPSGTGWLLEARAPLAEPIATRSVFALGLVAQYAAVAVRNVELYTELDARRGAVVELNQVKADLIAMLAHDFTGPLTSIVGFAQILAEDPGLDAASRQFLDTITQNALRLAGLATDTLALSRLENSDFALIRQPIDIGELVREVSSAYAERRTINLHIDEAAVMTRGDGPRMHQVIENLLGNAIKYSPNGEPVDITVRHAGEQIEIAFKDRGIGVPPGELPNLFSRFARGSNARRLGITGTGFGLYLARLIVEKHGGAVDVDSIEGAGSTFTVRLRAASDEDEAPPSRRVLLVDTEGEARSFTAHALRGAHYRLRVVQTASEALALLADERFDAVLVDGELADSQFLKGVSRRVRREVAFVRVCSDRSENREWDATIGKPFLSKDLVAAIDAAIGTRVPNL